MKRFIAAALVAALGSFALVGCGTGTPGGPGTKKDGTVAGPAEDTFTLSVPTLSTSVKQGETKQITIGIKRGKNFSQDVALKFDGLPKGVTMDPASPDIKAGEEEAKVNVKASDEAAIGDFTVKVVGHPKTGTDASNEFKVSVSKK
jgi:uncharacterized membrane protein